MVFLLAGVCLVQDAAVVSLVELLFWLLERICSLFFVVLKILQYYFAVFDETALENHILFGLLVLNLTQIAIVCLGLHGIKPDDQACSGQPEVRRASLQVILLFK